MDLRRAGLEDGLVGQRLDEAGAGWNEVGLFLGGHRKLRTIAVNRDDRYDAFGAPRLGCERVRAGDDLEDLLRDFGLASAVHGQGEAVDQLAGVLRRVAHRGHARALLRRGRLEQRTVELGLEVDGQQAGEDLLRLGLVDEVAELRPLCLLGLLVAGEELLGDREDLLLGHALDERRDEVVVDHDHLVDLLARVELGEPVGGNTYMFGSLEYSIPIIERLRFALFYDIGTVNSDAYDFSLSNYSDNWGVGLRVNIPGMGPLRFDYGIPIQARDNSKAGKFQFGVGYTREF